MDCKGIINIVITTKNLGYNIKQTDLYPIAYRTTEEAEKELLLEGFHKTERKHEYEWNEENLRKTANLKYTNIG